MTAEDRDDWEDRKKATSLFLRPYSQTQMFAVTLEAFGAFLSGAAAVLGAGVAIRMLVKRLDKQCDIRLDAFREGLDRSQGQAKDKDKDKEQ